MSRGKSSGYICEIAMPYLIEVTIDMRQDSPLSSKELWIPALQRICNTPVPVLLVGLKSDLRPENEHMTIKVETARDNGDTDTIVSVAPPPYSESELAASPPTLFSDADTLALDDTATLVSNSKLVSSIRARALASAIGASYFECSALTHEGVDALFLTVAKKSAKVRNAIAEGGDCTCVVC
ncbi:hypothetical protein HYDPIDRAFT_28524 [Hydnomerulius pinastri MD-312]|uniref:Uncharacterized protein n=1 Tax=Hydnomerulius pinastri MD-312 TaxID=994086 RepID=A0A0C9W170_9AGAM|nr:hypothetical protein HYDPIDRAFT_28524 [Hydnomerulius pinastri MD-312]